jgi:hypothetical protein
MTPRTSIGSSFSLASRGNRKARRDGRDAQGFDHGPLHFNLFYRMPSEGNTKAEALHVEPILHYAPARQQHGRNAEGARRCMKTSRSTSRATRKLSRHSMPGRAVVEERWRSKSPRLKANALTSITYAVSRIVSASIMRSWFLPRRERHLVRFFHRRDLWGSLSCPRGMNLPLPHKSEAVEACGAQYRTHILDGMGSFGIRR